MITLFHIAMIAGHHDQRFRQISHGEQAPQKTIKALKVRNSRLEIAPMAKQIAVPMFKEDKVMRLRQLPELRTRRGGRIDGYVPVAHLCPTLVGKISRQGVTGTQRMCGGQKLSGNGCGIRNGAQQPFSAINGLKIPLGIGIAKVGL